MGRGKKKGDKKKDAEPDIGSLSISGDQPSTSRETSAPPEVAAPAPAPSAPAPSAPVPPAPAPASAPAPAKATAPIPSEPQTLEVDDDDGGLGLGKSKKRRPRKKKESAVEAASQPMPAPAAAPAPEQSMPASAAATGAGRGAGRAWGPPPAASSQPGHPQQPAFPGQQHPPGFQPPGIQPGYPPAHPSQPGHPGYPPGQPGYPPGQPGYPPPGQSGYPPPGKPGFPPPGQPGYPPPGQPGYPPPGQPGYPPPGQAGLPLQQGPPRGPPPAFGGQQGAGRGRGAGRGQAPGAGEQYPGPSVPQQQIQPPQSVAATTGPQGDTRRTPPFQTTSLFKIPPKIIAARSTVMHTPGTVITNYLKMEIANIKVHRYDVTFNPDKPKKLIPKAFIEVKRKHFPQHLIAFDQFKNCYCLKPLPNVVKNDRYSVNIEVTDNNGRVLKFEVSFKATGIVDLSTITNYMTTGGTSLNPPTEAIQCIDVILRQGTLENYIKAGRQFFKRPARPIDLGDGLEMWTGLFQSAIFTSRAFINIDVAHKGFPKQQPLVDAYSRDFRLDTNSPIERQRGPGVEAFQSFLKGLRVVAFVAGDTTAKGQKREFICNDLVEPPNRLTFLSTDKNGKETKMTVADYFAKEKRIRLRYPNLNCVWVGPRDKSIYYPMELLEVSYGHARNKQLNERQLSTMVREAATPPDERKRKIEEVIRDMNYSASPDFQKFGLKISNEFHKVPAKVLTAPKLDVGSRAPIQPMKGSWQARSLLKPEALESWAFIAIEMEPGACNGEQIISLLKSSGQDLGMRVSEPHARYYNTSMRDLKNVLFEALAKEIKFLVIIVPTRGRDYYHKVKQLAEREVGILTQCIKEYTASRRMNPQTAKNILLKVNSKLMGINQALDKSSVPRCIAQGGVMVVGADVTHPSPDQTSVPSIAAVTASIDPKCFIYNIQLSIQTPKKEMIVEFEDMMVEHLRVYAQRQGNLPRKIFVFRDGVSEGQFAQVMNSELQAVHKAYHRLSGGKAKPEVLFLLVQKRHHTRFFNADARNASQNVLPGTVVDTEIVHAKELDFYLVSHQAIKGTARPTRYHAVCNDGNISSEEVEQLTYYLCHLFSRCMRAVSYPTPTYYAHLACLRARSLTYGEKFNNDDLEKNPRRLHVLQKMLDFSRMFFV